MSLKIPPVQCTSPDRYLNIRLWHKPVGRSVFFFFFFFVKQITNDQRAWQRLLTLFELLLLRVNRFVFHFAFYTHGRPADGLDKRQTRRKPGRCFFPIINAQDLFTKPSVEGAARQFEVLLVKRHCRFDFINNNSLIAPEFKKTIHEHNCPSTDYIPQFSR